MSKFLTAIAKFAHTSNWSVKFTSAALKKHFLFRCVLLFLFVLCYCLFMLQTFFFVFLFPSLLLYACHYCSRVCLSRFFFSVLMKIIFFFARAPLCACFELLWACVSMIVDFNEFVKVGDLFFTFFRLAEGWGWELRYGWKSWHWRIVTQSDR